MAEMNVSIIIPLYNQVAFTKVCLEYLLRNTPMEGVEVVLVDNASSDDTGAFLQSITGNVKKIRNESNLGFAKACNQGARAATGRNLVFLNNDTAPHDGWLQALLEPFSTRDGIGMTGPKLIYPDNTIQQAGVVFEQNGLPYHLYTNLPGGFPGANKPRFFRAVTGACFAVPKTLFDQVGGFDERYRNGLEDIDLCLKIDRLRRGILYNPASVVTHFESRSENRQVHMGDNARLFVGIWGQGPERFDDHLYLHQDGMSLWFTPDLQRRFLPIDAINDRIWVHVERAERLARGGDYKSAMEIYRAVMIQAPYSTEVLLKVEALASKLGLHDVAQGLRNRVGLLKTGLQGYGIEGIPHLAAA
jgi:GT2 family glycosyltransferase